MSPYPVPATASQSKRLVLFLAANPTNTQPLRLDEEVRAIRQQLQRSVLTLDSCWAVRPSDMQQEILRLKPQIVHFSGHGIGEPPSIDSGNRTLSPVGKNYLHDEEGLAFIRDATGQAALVGAEALANLFKHFRMRGVERLLFGGAGKGDRSTYSLCNWDEGIPSRPGGDRVF